MRTVLLMISVLFVARAAHAQSSFATDTADAARAARIAAEVERIATERDLWPGFDPLAVPLAVYTGERTYLFRHPSPPEEFSVLTNVGRHARVMQGRHPAVVANSSVELGGVMTATLLADGERARPGVAALAATAIHEAFHVFQRARHRAWSANEGDVFLYPTDDGALLALRRLESAALRHALSAAAPERAACWAGIAMAYRTERFAAMDQAFSSYERLTELNEGLATYVQRVAAGDTTIRVPAAFSADEVRQRTYVTGPALAFLLDRLSARWKESLEADDTQFLDQLLVAAAGAAVPGEGAPCAFEQNEVVNIEQTARRDAAAVLTARVERRKEFDGRAGWRVVIHVADGEPLWPQGFDPLNVERVEGGLLHTRFLRLGNGRAELQVMDAVGSAAQALTEGVGPHPLFNGIRQVTIAGLPEPEISSDGERVTIRAPGLVAELAGASVDSSGREVRIVIGASTP